MQIPGRVGDICLAPAPYFLSRLGVWGDWWGWRGKAGRTQGQPTDCRAVVGDHSCRHLPSGPHNHFETQVAEGSPDMPLCLSPARLDGPHLSCLVSWRPLGDGVARHGPWELTLLRSSTSASVSSLCLSVSPDPFPTTHLSAIFLKPGATSMTLCNCLSRALPVQPLLWGYGSSIF